MDSQTCPTGTSSSSAYSASRWAKEVVYNFNQFWVGKAFDKRKVIIVIYLTYISSTQPSLLVKCSNPLSHSLVLKHFHFRVVCLLPPFRNSAHLDFERNLCCGINHLSNPLRCFTTVINCFCSENCSLKA